MELLDGKGYGKDAVSVPSQGWHGEADWPQKEPCLKKGDSAI